MQNNNFLSRDKTQALIDGIGVKQADGAAFLKGLADQGYVIEGYNEPKAEPTLGQELKQRGTNAIDAVKQAYNENSSIVNDSTLTPTQKTIGVVSNTAQVPLRVAGQVGGAIGDTIGATISPILTPVIQGGAELAKKVLPTSNKVSTEPSLIDKATTAWKSFEQANPEQAQSLKDVGNLLNFAGVEAGGKVVVKGITESTIPVAKTALNKTSGLVKSAGERTYISAYTPSVKEAEQILAYEATKPSILSKIYGAGALEGNPAFKPVTVAETALRSKIAGTEKQIGIQAKQVADTLYSKEIKPAVAGIKGVITKDELFAPLQERIANIVDPSKQKAYQDAYESLVEDYANIKSFTFPQAQTLKSELAQFTPAKIFRGQDVANEARMLQADIAKTIREKTYDALKDINVKQKYIDYGNLQELQKVGIKAISDKGLKGGFGGFWSSLYDTAMTPVKTIGGKVLYKIGDKLEVTAPKGFEGKPLKGYLESVGYLAPGSINSVRQ